MSETQTQPKPELTPLPVSNLRDAAPHLRRPFTAEAIKFKVQAKWPQNRGGLVVAYIDARQVIERLNAVIPDRWETTYEPLPGSKAMICHLTVCGRTRSDVGEAGNSPKAAYSFALKRAGVHFGIAVSLYAMKAAEFLATENGAVDDNDRPTLQKKGRGDKETVALTPRVEGYLRGQYDRWLESTGERLFGAVLDHGDQAGAFGLEDEDAGAETDYEPAPSLEAAAAIERAQKAYDQLTPIQRRGLSKAKFDQQLRAASASEEGMARLEADLKERAK